MRSCVCVCVYVCVCMCVYVCVCVFFILKRGTDGKLIFINAYCITGGILFSLIDFAVSASASVLVRLSVCLSFAHLWLQLGLWTKIDDSERHSANTSPEICTKSINNYIEKLKIIFVSNYSLQSHGWKLPPR